ncbi:glutamate receptor 3-like [Haemaphysalis longicornis]
MKAALVVRTEITSIRDVDDLAKNERITPIVLRSSGFYWIFKQTKTDVFQKVLERVVRMNGAMAKDDMFTVRTLKRILKGEAVIIFVESALAAEVGEMCDKLGLFDSEFYFAPRPVTQMPMTMFIRRELDPALQTAIAQTIAMLIERGFLDKFYRDSGMERPPCRRQSAMGQERANASSQMDSLQGVFFVWLAGLLLATVALFVERLWHRFGTRQTKPAPRQLRHRR